MSIPIHRWSIVVATVSSLLLSGCYRTTRTTVLPTPVTLIAPDGFTLFTASPGSTGLDAHCRVLRIDARVTDLRADTLFVQDVHVANQSPDAEPCGEIERAAVIANADPTVRIETRRADRVRSVALYAAGSALLAVLLRVTLFND